MWQDIEISCTFLTGFLQAKTPISHQQFATKRNVLVVLGMYSINGWNVQHCKYSLFVPLRLFKHRDSPSLPRLGTRPDKLLTCRTSLSRDTLLIFLRISTGNGPPGSTTVTSQGQMTSRNYAISSSSKVNVVQKTCNWSTKQTSGYMLSATIL